MDWATICPALISLFSRLALPDGVDPPDGWAAEWKERRDHFIQPDVAFAVRLKVTSCVAASEDERVYAMAAVDPDNEDAGEDLFETVVGDRRFTLQVQVETVDHEDELFAMTVTERIRTGLSRSSTNAALLEVNTRIDEVRPAIKATRTLDKRRVSIANMDVIFVSRVNNTDPIPVGWIEFVNVESRFNSGDPDSPLPSPPNNAPGEWIPPLPEP